MNVWLSVCLGFIAILLTLFVQKMKNGLYSHAIVKLRQAYYNSALLHRAMALLSSDPPAAPGGLPAVMKVERISSNVTRVLGLNPGPHTLQGTNTYLVGTSSAKILVDTGEHRTAAEYVSLLLDEVFPATQTASLSHILLTHGHGDHQGGLESILAALKARGMTPLPSVHKYESPTGKFPVKHPITAQNIQNGETFETEGATLRALYAPGHTDDHVCFILKENHAMLSGDCILGCGTAVFEDLHSYMASLQRLRRVMGEGYVWNHHSALSSARPESIPIASIYPGHGPVLSSAVKEKVDEYIAHREERERQIVDYLRASCSDTRGDDWNSWRSSWEVMSAIYPSSLHVIIKMSAQHNVQHHLAKLLKDGVVSTRWPDLWRCNKANTTSDSYVT